MSSERWKICKESVRSAISVLLIYAGLCTGFQPALGTLRAQAASSQEAPADLGPAQAAADAGQGLKIVVIEGEDGVNIIKSKTVVKPVVEVRDRNNNPVAGVVVRFLLPRSGPGGTFAHGAKSVTVVTDSSGRAAVASMNPSGVGSFQIQVSTSSPEQAAPATITIPQTNYLTLAAAEAAGVGGAAAGAAAGGGISTGLAIGIAAGVAAAVTGAIIAAKVIGGGGKKTKVSIGTPRIP